MSAPNRARFGRRAVAVLLANVVCLLAIGLFVLHAQHAASDAAGRADRLRQAQLESQDLLIGMVNQETGIRGYVDAATAVFLQPYVLGEGEAATAEQRLRAVLAGSNVLDATVAAADSWQQWAAGRKQAVDARAAPEVSASAALDGKRRFDAFRAAQAELERALDQGVASALAEASHDSDQSGRAALIGAVGGGVILSLLGVLLVRASIERQGFFTLALDAHAVVDPSGRLRDANPALERITGLGRRELLTRRLGELVHPGDRELAQAALDSLAHSAELVDVELRILSKDRSDRRISWNAASWPGSGMSHAVGRDVTEERRARDVLQAQAQLLELSHDAILVRDTAESRITYWSKGAEDTYEWTAAEALGRISHELLSTRSPRPLQDIEVEVLDTGRWQGELTHRLRGGGSIVVDSRWALHTDPTGAPDSVLEINRDITQRKRLEDALTRSNDELVRVSYAKSDFLSRMSHELRTPLNAIIGFSQLLTSDVESRDREFVHRIHRAGCHLLALIDDVLDISRIESGVLHVSLEPVPIAGVVAETTELIRPGAAGRRIALTTALHGMSGQHVLADLQRLKQVLLNLMSNAVKYNREGGSISIAAERHGGRVGVSITDTGPGIPPQNLHRLFEPFDRLGAESTEVEGTGLGLAISKQLLTAMGGSISVESSDQGTTFSVELAASESPDVEEPRVQAPTCRAQAPGGGVRTVLYVEDNLSTFELVKHILDRRRGVVVLPAMQGRLALDLAREHSPDLVLLDIHLADLSGYEVLRRLRAEERTAHIPVVVISADVTDGQISRCLEAGARACLTKPLDVDRFLRVVDEVLVGSTDRGLAP